MLSTETIWAAMVAYGNQALYVFEQDDLDSAPVLPCVCLAIPELIHFYNMWSVECGECGRGCFFESAKSTALQAIEKWESVVSREMVGPPIDVTRECRGGKWCPQGCAWCRPATA